VRIKCATSAAFLLWKIFPAEDCPHPGRRVLLLRYFFYDVYGLYVDIFRASSDKVLFSYVLTTSRESAHKHTRCLFPEAEHVDRSQHGRVSTRACASVVLSLQLLGLSPCKWHLEFTNRCFTAVGSL
jgi:hypothetical protein